MAITQDEPNVCGNFPQQLGAESLSATLAGVSTAAWETRQ